MATNPVRPADAEPDVVGQIILLRPDQIDASGRLRQIDPVWAEALACVMKAEGQRTPIEVCKLPGRSDYKLVTGGHRHAAAEMAGMYLRAEVVTNDAAERRLREVSENLHRRDLSPIDRAAFIAELAALHKVRAGIDPEKDGRSASAHARWEKALKEEADDATETISVAYGWSDELGEQLGVTARTIRNDLLLHRRLSPAAADKLRRHAVGNNASQLRALAKMPPAQQSAIADMIVEGTAKSVADAVATFSQKPKPDAETKRLSTFIGTFQRMGVAEKKGALINLKPLLPAGINLGQGADHAAKLDALIAALTPAFEVLTKLSLDEGVDDDEIRDAHATVQDALMGGNSARAAASKGGK